MAFFIQISIYWALLWVASHFIFKEKLRSHARKGRIAFSAGFVLIGIVHLVKPQSLAYMIEGLLPYATELVVLTGLIEIVLALLLHKKGWQKITGWMIIAYLIAVFPANIQVAVQQLNPPGGLPAAPWYTWSRLLFQPLYILWIYLAAIRPYHQVTARKQVKAGTTVGKAVPGT